MSSSARAWLVAALLASSARAGLARAQPVPAAVACFEPASTSPADGCDGSRWCAIPSVFDEKADPMLERAVQEKDLADAANTTDEALAHLREAHDAYGVARQLLGDQCNPNLLLSWARVAKKLGWLKLAADHLAPLQCVVETGTAVAPGCVLHGYADPVSQGRALARQIELERRPLVALAVTPPGASIRMETERGEVALPEPIDGQGKRRLLPGTYVFRVSADGYQPAEIQGEFDYDADETLRASLLPLLIAQPRRASRRGGVVATGSMLLANDTGGVATVMAAYRFSNRVSGEVGGVFASAWLGPRLSVGASTGERWTLGIRGGGSLLFPHGAPEDEHATALAGAHLEARGGYRWGATQGFLTASTEFFPAAEQAVSMLLGGGVLWSFWGEEQEAD